MNIRDAISGRQRAAAEIAELRWRILSPDEATVLRNELQVLRWEYELRTAVPADRQHQLIRAHHDGGSAV